MKQGTPIITIVMVALAAALVVYFGYYVFDTFNDPFTTTLVYSYTASDSAEADGMLAREEVVIPAQSGIVDITRSEGERVAAGKQVALVYRDVQAQADQAELEQLALEIQLLEQTAAGVGSVESAARLDEEILQAVVELRFAAALGDFNELEDQVLALKSGVLKRGYTYGEGLTAADLSQRLSQLRSQYSDLRTQASTATTRITASQAGTFSSLVDGYEELLTPQTVFQLTPSSLEELMSRTVSGDGLGKLILGYRWYFAAALPQETAQRLTQGDTATLRFTGDFQQDVDMLVEQIGQTEEGRTLVVFSSDEYLSQTTLLRRQTAELIFESWTGLRIPKEVLRLEKVSYTDPDTSQEREDTRLGVYVLVGGRTEFKSVEVVTEGTDYYVVKAATNGSDALRAGDEVIVQGVGLYDGQLLEF